MDITENIEKQKERFNLIIEGTNIGTWEWNIQSGKIIVNQTWAQMLGYNLEELKPSNIEDWRRLTHPQDLKKSNQAFKRHVEGKKEFYNAEIRMKHKEGHWIWVFDRGKIISWTEDGKPFKMFGSLCFSKLTFFANNSIILTPYSF